MGLVPGKRMSEDVPVNFEIGFNYLQPDDCIRDIALVPGSNPPKLLRWHPHMRSFNSFEEALAAAARGLPTHDAEGALQDIKNRSLHHGMLERFGVIIPRYSSFIGGDPDVFPQRTFHASVYDLVEYVDCKPLDGALAKSRLARSLAKYVSWVAITSQPLMLNDIFRTEEYGMTVDERPILFDIEPRLQPPVDNQRGRQWLEIAIDYIHELS